MSLRSETVAAVRTVAEIGRAVFADEYPEGEQPPYVVVRDRISEAPALTGDSKAMAFRRLIQLDLWEFWDVATDALPDAIVGVLDGLSTQAGTRLRLQGSTRVQDPDLDLVHTTFTFEVVRLRGASSAVPDYFGGL